MGEGSPVILVRRAVAADAPFVEALYRQLVSNPSVAVLPQRLAEIAKDPDTALLVGELESRVCGTALVSLCADVMFKSQPFAIVENVIVDAAARGKGVGAALLGHIEDFCYDAECSKIMLLSSTEREQAHRFFERIGFLGSSKRGFVKYRRNFQTLP